MIQFTDEMKELIDNALTNGTPCIVATASRVGEPGVSYRGSMMTFGDDALAYWDRTKRAGLEHIEANPNVVVMLHHPKLGKSWKFHGKAEIYRDGKIREQIMSRVVDAELNRDPKHDGIGIIVRLNRISLLSGEMIQEKD